MGNIDLSHLRLENLTAHRVHDLAEPLLSVSAITDTGKGVVFLLSTALIVHNPLNLE